MKQSYKQNSSVFLRLQVVLAHFSFVCACFVDHLPKEKKLFKRVLFNSLI